ncbi:MAG: protoglobin domain-containing protein [Armatimonadota bacterium]
MYQRVPEEPEIPGYAYGSPDLPQSPISLQELELLKQTVLFTDEDVQALKMAGEVLADQTETILDVWYDYVGAHPHLVKYFSTPDGQPIPEYLQRVRARFGRWILDTCFNAYDQQWLDYQYEIALRHYPKKNTADGVNAVPVINYHYIVAFIYPLTATIKPFLTQKGHSQEEVEKMFNAWFKSVTMQAALWGCPYMNPSVF